MSFFNFIETVFFLSLGITFVLILLLVYHFKQRLSALENKCDTVFEIISNVVDELSGLKQNQIQIHANLMNISQSSGPFVSELNSNFRPFTSVNDTATDRIKVVDEDLEEDDEEDDDEDDEEDDEDDEDDEDEEDYPSLINGTFEVDDNLENSTIRIINVEMNEPIESETIGITEVDQDNAESEENDKIENIELQEDKYEEIHVEKLEETNALENNNHSDDLNKDSKEVYSKMPVNSLKTLVISKGLSSDPSKLKKTELLKLLETVEN